MSYQTNRPYGRRRTDGPLAADERKRLEDIRHDVDEDSSGLIRRYLRLVPTASFIRTLNAARLAADVSDVDTLLIARTDAHSATLITSDIDDYDRPWISGDADVDDPAT